MYARSGNVCEDLEILLRQRDSLIDSDTNKLILQQPDADIQNVYVYYWLQNENIYEKYICASYIATMLYAAHICKQIFHTEQRHFILQVFWPFVCQVVCLQRIEIKCFQSPMCLFPQAPPFPLILVVKYWQCGFHYLRPRCEELMLVVVERTERSVCTKIYFENMPHNWEPRADLVCLSISHVLGISRIYSCRAVNRFDTGPASMKLIRQCTLTTKLPNIQKNRKTSTPTAHWE